MGTGAPPKGAVSGATGAAATGAATLAVQQPMATTTAASATTMVFILFVVWHIICYSVQALYKILGQILKWARSMSTTSIFGAVFHAPRVKSGTSIDCERFVALLSVSSQRQPVVARS